MPSPLHLLNCPGRALFSRIQTGYLVIGVFNGLLAEAKPTLPRKISPEFRYALRYI
jgi:hypothetical protein